jgi:hypothetical protein
MKKEKKERIKQLVKKLAEFSDEQRELIAQKFGIRNPEGHLLSGRNMMLLYLQAEDKPLSIVAGFQQWKKYNRFVKKGEHGYLIAVPANIKKSEAEQCSGISTGEAEDPEYFIYKSVFDISQTTEKEEITESEAA